MNNVLNEIQSENRFSVRSMLVNAFSGMFLPRIKYRSWRTKAGILLVISSIISGFMTYAALSKSPPFGDNPDLVIWLLNIDLVILLLLVFLIAKRIIVVWSNKKKGVAGSSLHIRLVYIFSILVAVPTIIMTFFSVLLFHYGVQAWFSDRVQTAINESQAVAQSYLEEHKQVIRADTLAMANDIDRQSGRLVLNEALFAKVIDTQSYIRNLSEALVINNKGRVMARSSMTFTLEYELPTSYDFKQADQGGVVLVAGKSKDRVRALTRLRTIPNAYLYVGRMIDPQVISHLISTDLAVKDYKNLQIKSSGLQITVILIFVVVGLLLLLAAIWLGLLLARQLVNPIGELITASDRVRAGDLSSRLPNIQRLEEFEYLARSFNRMTSQLQSQRDDLIDANIQIDQRRRLIETVLAGVSSGVIGVDSSGLINLANNSAANLLQKTHDDITNHYILDIIPELKSMLEEVAENPKKTMQKEVMVFFEKSGRRSFLFRISIEELQENTAGLIITFDDITDLQSAQRNAAWSDVARRIAHEIKNPLTPIQLSAERLKRKYLKEVNKDPEIFEQCTDTIVKHVEDIGRMVDEFSSFARMPAPSLKSQSISKIIQDSLVLVKQVNEDIEFSITHDFKNDKVNCDARQIRQVITNLLKNSCEAIEMKGNNNNCEKGIVNILIGHKSVNEIFIAINDNGVGFPTGEDVVKLTEPYITHKPKGTGLGLAIVKKIIEDHNGEMILGVPDWLESNNKWKDKGGACIVISFPVSKAIVKKGDR